MKKTLQVAEKIDGDQDHERGDVPGWVLVTVMTAALVTAIWAVAQPALISLFEKAISNVGLS